MIYKTLHWYILRELLRVFLMTASALTTLLAFGGTFKPLTKEGIDVLQLMMITTNLMPAMLAYAIPIAALFAAVLVYWRLSTDNELTACRASGISFGSILMPALVLGIVVATVDLVFVNFVVPSFLQSTERLIRRDAAQLMVSAISKQDVYRDPNDKVVIYADSAEQLESKDPDVQIVHLEGVVGVKLGPDKSPEMIGTALSADVTFTQQRDPPGDPNGKLLDETHVTISVSEAAAYDPQRFTSLKKDFEEIMPPSRPYKLFSQLKDKPKFSNLYELRSLNAEPWKYAPLKEQLGRFDRAKRQYDACVELDAEYKTTKRFEFVDGGGNRYVARAPIELFNNENVIILLGDQKPVTVEVFDATGKLFRRYVTMTADITLKSDEISPIRATINLRKSVTKEELIGDYWTPPVPLSGFGEIAGAMGGSMAPKEFVEQIPNLRNSILDQPKYAGSAVTTSAGYYSLYMSAESQSRGPKGNLTATAKQVVDIQKELTHTISSELHSRGSFSVSCLTLVMFGAALGVTLKGRNPLAVFVMGFMPSVLLVLLITMGRRVMETASGNQTLGLCLLWAGNAVLVLLVFWAYRRLMKT
jgi:lipopolysaccharide export LptBFGC system permease protein LptF